MKTRFIRLFSPATILTADAGTFKRAARSLRSASLARSSTGGAQRRTFNTPCTSPSIASRLARGVTRTAKLTPLFCTVISMGGLFCAFTEESRAEADFGSTLFDVDFESVAHAHRENGKRPIHAIG